MRSQTLSSTWLTRAVWAGLAVAYAAARLVELASARPDRTADTHFYFETVGVPPLAMFAGIRPLTAPLLWTMVGGSPDAIVFFQVLLATVSWALLAVMVARALQAAWLKYCAFASVTIIGLAWDVAHWNYYLVGESISLSLLVLVVVCCLWLLEGWHPLKLASLLLAALLWVNVRDSNPYALLMLAAVTTTMSLAPRNRLKNVLLTIAFVLIAFTAITSSMAGDRWVFPYLNVIGKRILPDSEKTAYFARSGMPVTPALMSMSGKWAPDENGAFYFDPRLQSFRDWATSQGKQTYAWYLLTHPLQTLAEPLSDVPDILAFSPRDQAPALFLLVAAAFSLLLVGLQRPWSYFRVRPSWLVPSVLLLLTYPHAVLIWHGDVMDVTRHLLQASIQLRLGLCLVLLFSIDALATSRVREPRHSRNVLWTQRGQEANRVDLER